MVWGVVLLAIGIMARKWGSVLVAGLTIASIPFGALLGVFLLGVLTKRVGQRAAMAGVVAGLAVDQSTCASLRPSPGPGTC